MATLPLLPTRPKAAGQAAKKAAAKKAPAKKATTAKAAAGAAAAAVRPPSRRPPGPVRRRAGLAERVHTGRIPCELGAS
jgi:hypothetical protein